MRFTQSQAWALGRSYWKHGQIVLPKTRWFRRGADDSKGPGQPDRDTESIFGVDPATDTLEVGGVQSVKHVESTLQCKLPSCPTELWDARMTRLVLGYGLVKRRARITVLVRRAPEQLMT